MVGGGILGKQVILVLNLRSAQQQRTMAVGENVHLMLA